MSSVSSFSIPLFPFQVVQTITDAALAGFYGIRTLAEIAGFLDPVDIEAGADLNEIHELGKPVQHIFRNYMFHFAGTVIGFGDIYTQDLYEEILQDEVAVADVGGNPFPFCCKGGDVVGSIVDQLPFR